MKKEQGILVILNDLCADINLVHLDREGIPFGIKKLTIRVAKWSCYHQGVQRDCSTK